MRGFGGRQYDGPAGAYSALGRSTDGRPIQFSCLGHAPLLLPRRAAWPLRRLHQSINGDDRPRSASRPPPPPGRAITPDSLPLAVAAVAVVSEERIVGRRPAELTELGGRRGNSGGMIIEMGGGGGASQGEIDATPLSTSQRRPLISITIST